MHVLNSGDVVVDDLVGLLAELDQVSIVQFLPLQVLSDVRTDPLFTAQAAQITAFLVSAAGPAQAAFSAVLCTPSSVDPEILLRVIMIDFHLFIELAIFYVTDL